jgi:hypothetical protein
MEFVKFSEKLFCEIEFLILKNKKNKRNKRKKKKKKKNQF